MSFQPQLEFVTEKEEGRKSPDLIEFPLDSFKNKTYLTHNFHPYPAKFVPQIPRNVIVALSSKGESVLDPFCGSGTTLVEANILGRNAIGFDLNPLACLISKVKTYPLNESQINKIRHIIRSLKNIQASISSEKSFLLETQNIPEFLNRDHWFQHHVLQELALIKKTFWETDDANVLDFLKIAFSAIIVKVSNQDSDTRWVAVKKEIPVGFTIKTFILKLEEMTKRMDAYRHLTPATTQIFQQSITDQFRLNNESIDLVVTSPPYLNSYDYYLYHKLRFFWLGFDHHSVQAQEIGSRNKHSDNGEGIETYSNGILKAFKEIYRVLKSDKFLCVVIGDSILKGELIDMNKIYRSYGESAGFQLVHSFSFDQRKYSTAFTRNLKTLSKQSHIMFFRKN